MVAGAAAVRTVLFLAFAAATAIGAAADDQATLEPEARNALQGVFTALMTGDPETVRPWLAPEDQVQRSDGKGTIGSRRPSTARSPSGARRN